MDNTIYGCRKIQDKSSFEKLINEKSYAVLDVRSPVEYRNGTLMEAPNATLRNFTTEFLKTRRLTNKIILIGSREELRELESSIKYAYNTPNPDAKKTNLSYVFYEDIQTPQPKDKKRGR